MDQTIIVLIILILASMFVGYTYYKKFFGKKKKNAHRVCELECESCPSNTSAQDKED